jgi:hypothetical protein
VDALIATGDTLDKAKLVEWFTLAMATSYNEGVGDAQ